MTASIVQGMVDKYLKKWVKNATTEHAGIWEGELVFKNVELRLDVMQQELGLPMVFTRGFVQELRVYLPLANILRENICITLSNVEVVARTPNGAPDSVSAEKPAAPAHEVQTDTAQGSGTDQHDNGTRGPEPEKSKGWVASTLGKIMQNIRVELRNVVFKYCTERYVTTLSWKSLSYYPSSPSWTPRFTEAVGPTRARFQVLNVEHATWCLDPVDKDGVVSSYVSPFFNRESFQVRMIFRGRPGGDVARLPPLQLPATQIDARFKAFELSVSDAQVEMLTVLSQELQSMMQLFQTKKAKTKTPGGPSVPDDSSDHPESDASSTPRHAPTRPPAPSPTHAVTPAAALQVTSVVSVTMLEFVLVCTVGGRQPAPAEMLRVTSTGITLLLRQSVARLPASDDEYTGTVPSTPTSTSSRASGREGAGASVGAKSRRELSDVRVAVGSLHVAYEEDGRMRTLVRFGASMSALHASLPLPSRENQQQQQHVAAEHRTDARGRGGGGRGGSRGRREGSSRGGGEGESDLYNGAASLFARRGGRVSESDSSEYEVDENEEALKQRESDATSRALHDLFRCPLTKRVVGEQKREGGDLIEQLMGSAGGQLADLLLRKAHGEAVQWEVGEKDGWDFDDSASVVLAWSHLSAPRDARGSTVFGYDGQRGDEALGGSELEWAKVHVQPFNAIVTTRARNAVQHLVESFRVKTGVRRHGDPSVERARAMQSLRTTTPASVFLSNVQRESAFMQDDVGAETGGVSADGRVAELAKRVLRLNLDVRVGAFNVVVCGEEAADGVMRCCVVSLHSVTLNKRDDPPRHPAANPTDRDSDQANRRPPLRPLDCGASALKEAAAVRFAGKVEGVQVRVGYRHRGTGAMGGGRESVLVARGGERAVRGGGVRVLDGMRRLCEEDVGFTVEVKAGVGRDGDGRWELKGWMESARVSVRDDDIIHIFLVMRGVEESARGQFGESQEVFGGEEGDFLPCVRKGSSDRSWSSQAGRVLGAVGVSKQESERGRGGDEEHSAEEGGTRHSGGGTEEESEGETVLQLSGVQVECEFARGGQGSLRVRGVRVESAWVGVESGIGVNADLGPEEGGRQPDAIAFKWKFSSGDEPTDTHTASAQLLAAIQHSLSLHVEGNGGTLSSFPLGAVPLLCRLSASGCLNRRETDTRGRAARGARGDEWASVGAVWHSDGGEDVSPTWLRSVSSTTGWDDRRESVRMHAARAQMRELQQENKQLHSLLLQASARATTSISPTLRVSAAPHLTARSSSSVVLDVDARSARRPPLSIVDPRNAAVAARCLSCQRRGVGRDACDRLLQEARGLRRAVLALTRGLVTSSAKLRSVLSKPWPVVIALFTYAAILHIVIAMLLHSMAGLHDAQAGPALSVTEQRPAIAAAGHQASLMDEHMRGGALHEGRLHLPARGRIAKRLPRLLW